MDPRDYGFDQEAHIDQAQGQSQGLQPDVTNLGFLDALNE